jgi:chromosome segregation ATPase
LLKQQAESQKVDVLMKRVTLAATQLTNAQDRLSRIGQERRSLESERNELETRLAMFQKEPLSSPDAEANIARIAGIRNRLQTIQERLNALRQEQITAENEIEALRREARDWQALLDKTITGAS